MKSLSNTDKNYTYSDFFKHTKYLCNGYNIWLTYKNITITFDINDIEGSIRTDEDFFILMMSIVHQYHLAIDLGRDRYFNWCVENIDYLTNRIFADLTYLDKMYNIFCSLYDKDIIERMCKDYENDYKNIFLITKDILQVHTEQRAEMPSFLLLFFFAVRRRPKPNIPPISSPRKS